MKIILVLLLCFLTLSVYPVYGASEEKIIPLPELNQPRFIAIDGNRLFISEQFVIYIYSLEDNRLIKKFGSQGEGPQEFKYGTMMNLYSDGLAVISYGKISYYTRDGDYIKENRTPIHFYPGAKILTKDLFVSLKNYVEPQKSLWILDANFKPIIEVYKEKIVHRKEEFFANFWMFTAAENKIFSVKESEFQVGIYDTNGKEVASISREYKRVKFPQGFKEEIFQYINSINTSEETRQRMKKILIFPDFLPAISNLFYFDNKIYINTFAREKDNNEFFVYTTDGEFIERILLPITPVYNGYMFFYPYYIKDGKLYQLIENENTDCWELHISALKPE
ncbi:MAG TPA: hypothetical protein VK186_12030 [Candidatus Deferrimicrobium sp.]|nr:hypothetical protein [Candidatus Kapabacteria bacterium]HLP59556.1 hypothetical protein [Candidatus Deferrimicrobium sp.]